jgi:hypothetical protein
VDVVGPLVEGGSSAAWSRWVWRGAQETKQHISHRYSSLESAFPHACARPSHPLSSSPTATRPHLPQTQSHETALSNCPSHLPLRYRTCHLVVRRPHTSFSPKTNDVIPSAHHLRPPPPTLFGNLIRNKLSLCRRKASIRELANLKLRGRGWVCSSGRAKGSDVVADGGVMCCDIARYLDGSAVAGMWGCRCYA